MASKWYEQKDSAIERVIDALSDGKQMTTDQMTVVLKESGVSQKNALKAMYHAALTGSVRFVDGFSKIEGVK